MSPFSPVIVVNVVVVAVKATPLPRSTMVEPLTATTTTHRSGLYEEGQEMKGRSSHPTAGWVLSKKAHHVIHMPYTGGGA